MALPLALVPGKAAAKTLSKLPPKCKSTAITLACQPSDGISLPLNRHVYLPFELGHAILLSMLSVVALGLLNAEGAGDSGESPKPFACIDRCIAL